MGMPTENELTEALAEAARLRETASDPHFMAKALLNCHYRVQLLEHVLHAAERYLHSGQAVQEHEKLLHAIAVARQAQDRTAAREPVPFGLE